MQPIQTRLTALLRVLSPIVVPPMAGAVGGDLVAQVTLGGGYAFVATGLADSKAFSKDLEVVRRSLALPKQASLPIGAGYLGWLLDRGGDILETLRIGLEERVQSIWLSFGLDLGKWVEYIRQYDMQRPDPLKHKTFIWVVVNSVEEARKAVNDWKVDTLVVQGSEAGGHGHSQAPPLISLLGLIRDAIPNAPPLVVAGGIATGEQVAGLLAMNADGVVMGTRFLTATESLYSKNQKKAVIEATSSVRTLVFDTVRGPTVWPEGVDGRAIHNKTLDEAHEGIVDADERKRRYEEAMRNDDTSRLAVWSGSSVGLVKEMKPAKTLVEEIHEETILALRRVSKYLETTN